MIEHDAIIDYYFSAGNWAVHCFFCLTLLLCGFLFPPKKWKDIGLLFVKLFTKQTQSKQIPLEKLNMEEEGEEPTSRVAIVLIVMHILMIYFHYIYEVIMLLCRLE